MSASRTIEAGSIDVLTGKSQVVAAKPADVLATLHQPPGGIDTHTLRRLNLGLFNPPSGAIFVNGFRSPDGGLVVAQRIKLLSASEHPHVAPETRVGDYADTGRHSNKGISVVEFRSKKPPTFREIPFTDARLGDRPVLLPHSTDHTYNGNMLVPDRFARSEPDPLALSTIITKAEDHIADKAREFPVYPPKPAKAIDVYLRSLPQASQPSDSLAESLSNAGVPPGINFEKLFISLKAEPDSGIPAKSKTGPSLKSIKTGVKSALKQSVDPEHAYYDGVIELVTTAMKIRQQKDAPPYGPLPYSYHAEDDVDRDLPTNIHGRNNLVRTPHR